MNSIPSETLRTLEDIYASFDDFKEEGDIEKAQEMIQSLEDFFPDEAQRMRIELAKVQKEI